MIPSGPVLFSVGMALLRFPIQDLLINIFPLEDLK